MRMKSQKSANSFAKRVIDIIGTFALGLLSLPLWVFTIFAIKRDSSGPAIYTQERIGKGGCVIRIYKFRTMVQEAEQVLDDYLSSNPAAWQEWDQTHKLKNDPRVTRPGKWMRRYSIDELPQLYNVLKGEMSLVGPRPLPCYHHERLSDRGQKLRTAITPGLTGLWQVRGRSNNDLGDMERIDAYYVRNWSYWLDMNILLRTVWVVLSGEGAY